MVIKMIEVQACSPAPQQQAGRHHELHQVAVGGEVGEQQSNSGRIYKLLGQVRRSWSPVQLFRAEGRRQNVSS